jgi:hypothetical protein
MNSRLYINITPQQAERVLHYFYTNNDNRSTVISKALDIKLHYVDYIIDIDLKYKKNYHLDKFKKNKYVHKDTIKLKVYEGDILLGSFVSYRQAEKTLNLGNNLLYKYLQDEDDIITRYHTKLKKTYTYVKIA